MQPMQHRQQHSAYSIYSRPAVFLNTWICQRKLELLRAGRNYMKFPFSLKVPARSCKLRCSSQNQHRLDLLMRKLLA